MQSGCKHAASYYVVIWIKSGSYFMVKKYTGYASITKRVFPDEKIKDKSNHKCKEECSC